MDFDLSSDQLALRDAAAGLLERGASEEALRRWVGPGTVVGTLPGAAHEDHGAATAAPCGYDHQLWQAMADQGWLSVERPEDHGGLGLGMVEVAVLCEQLGRRVAPAPFLPTVLAAQALAGAATDDEELVRLGQALYEGEAVGTVCWSQDPQAVTVAHGAQGPTVTGTPDPVLYGPSAEVAVLAATDGLYAVALGAGQRPAPQAAMDRTRELGWLPLDATPALRVGDQAAATRLMDRAATGTSAELLGVAAAALDMAVAYAKDRVQFGRPIGSFQAIKHKLADALVDVEGMRSTVYYAAWCVAQDHPEATLAASMAKAWCSDASRRVMATALQVHGGIGFTWEHPLHLYVKRAQLDQVSFGDAPWHRQRIAALVRRRLEAGGEVFA